MSANIKSSHVSLLLKKNSKFSKVKKFNANSITPNLKRLAFNDDTKITKDFYELIIETINSQFFEGIICSKKFFKNLQFYGLNKNILFVDDGLNNTDLLSSFNKEIPASTFAICAS